MVRAGPNTPAFASVKFALLEPEYPLSASCCVWVYADARPIHQTHTVADTHTTQSDSYRHFLRGILSRIHSIYMRNRLPNCFTNPLFDRVCGLCVEDLTNISFFKSVFVLREKLYEILQARVIQTSAIS